MDYLLLKTVHQVAAGLSVAGFTARLLGALQGAAWVRHRLALTLPHAVDSVLLAAAAGMAWTVAINPLATPWLLAKIVGLLVYIALGVVALRPGRPRALRAAAGALALVAVAYIVSVAVSKSPLGFFSL